MRIPPTMVPGTREEGGQYTSPLAAHQLIFQFINILGVFLQVKHATGDLPSPFVTDHNTIMMLIVDLLAYAGTLETARILKASRNTNGYEWINNISLLCGTSAVILLLLLLDRDLGWFVFACWVASIGIIVTMSYETPRRLCTVAVDDFREKMKELMGRLKGTEEPENQDRMT
ncbi:uncharacterized protein LOC125474118 [Pyrus x bretschneideri]|uniref:uncharacterized protein LOC125474118 n=1 Tax=Pyrus x bretschneideri TaxID=225117 RepID=UPI00202E8AB7|nr:uncharacterized protein LOC125474118 [Pyrus x bretschneideri]